MSPIFTDIIVWIIATALAALARYDFDAAHVRWEAIAVLALFLAGGQLFVGGLVLMYSGRYVQGSFDELRSLAVSATTVCVLSSAIVAVLRPNGVARSIPFLAWTLALIGMAAVRYVKRSIRQSNRHPGEAAEPILIMGAGWVGSAMALQMTQDPASPYRPVGFLDDDPAKRNLQIHGVRVRGRLADLEGVAGKLHVRRVVVAIGHPNSTLLRRISDDASAAGLVCLVAPPLKDLLRGAQVQLSSLREIAVEDVIGRHPVHTDVTAIAHYITGQRVLVTGAGGSIGSELCRQIHAYGPAELVMLDRDESALHAVELSITGHALLESSEIVLANIHDRDELADVFLEHMPQVVFHAAALKHLTLLERFPDLALKTNVYGTLNVLQASADNGVEHFVNISTDKAANPASALGHSKRIAEQLTAWFADQHDKTNFISVRFGNVLGSRGSVLHTFASQIENGGPVTVTDPDVARYFMTIPEACELVIQAGAIGRGSEVLVLDMGEPVKIVDVARRMIAMAGKDLEIVFTGLREGEKMQEELFGDAENGVRRSHPLIWHVDVPTLDPDDISCNPWARWAAERREHRAAIFRSAK